MKNKLLLFIVALFFTVLFISGCAVNPIVGEWRDSNLLNTVEFRSDGRVIWDIPTRSVFGTYELKDDDVLIIDFEGSYIRWEQEFGGPTWEYTINDNTLTMKSRERTYTFKKIKK